MEECKCNVCRKILILDEENVCAQCELITETTKKGETFSDLDCGICNKIIVDKGEGLYCSVCDKWFHNTCSENPLPEYVHNVLKEAPNNVKWFCDKCIWETEKWIDSLKGGTGTDRLKGGFDSERSDDLSDIEIDKKINRRKRGRPRRLRRLDDDFDNKYDETNEPECILDEPFIDDSEYESRPKKKVRRKKKTVKKVKRVNGQKRKHASRGLKRNNKCDICPKRFLTPEDLVAHKLWHDGDPKPFKCTECDSGFTLKSGLQQHIISHDTNKSFYCDICERGFKWKSAYMRHQKDYHSGDSEKLIECPEPDCDFSTTNQSRLDAHSLKHSDIRPFKCTKCDHASKTEWTLKAHMKTHDDLRPHKCQECDKAFKTPDGLTYHMYTHTGAWPFECAVCGAKFAAESALVAHARKHTDERPYACTICDAKFRIKSILNQHMQSHSGDRAVTCDICGKQLCHIGALKTHKMIHTGEKPYKCELCGKKCRIASTLKKHMEYHSKNNYQLPERPYECEQCGNRYKSIRSLHKHQRGDRGRRPCQGEFGNYYKGPITGKNPNEQKPELTSTFSDKEPLVNRHDIPPPPPKKARIKSNLKASLEQSLKASLEQVQAVQQAQQTQQTHMIPKEIPNQQLTNLEQPSSMHSLTVTGPQNFQNPPSLLYAGVTNNYQQFHELYMNASTTQWAQNTKYWN